MAVELTKVALWFETLDPGLPLGFLDAQIRCGDSLLGVFDLQVLQEGIPDAAYRPLTGDDKDTARYYLQANRAAKSGQGAADFAAGRPAPSAMPPPAPESSEFRDLPEDTPAQLAAKAGRFRARRQDPSFLRRQTAADLYLAAFLLPKTGGPPAGASARTLPTSAELWMALAGQDRPPAPGDGPPSDGRCAMAQASEAARQARAFHWPLEFPDTMRRGGFDLVLGNPPWERIKLQEKEFFAARDEEIATAPNAAARKRLIDRLRSAGPAPARALWDAFRTAKRLSEALSNFVRLQGHEGERFPLTGRGDVNAYQLFAELFAALARPHGRAGAILPTGIATEVTAAPFFSRLIARRRLSRLADFENRAGLFPAVARLMKFCLLTLGRDQPAPRFAFFLTEPAQLADPERNFTLSPQQIATFNSNTRTAPVFRSRRDADLTAKLYARAPVLIDESDPHTAKNPQAKNPRANPWAAEFQRLFDMSLDSRLFRTGPELQAEGFLPGDCGDWIEAAPNPLDPSRGTGATEGSFLPLYEAKMLHHFDHRWAGYDPSGKVSEAPAGRKSDPHWQPRPRYWVAAAEVADRLRQRNWTRGWLLGCRGIARATDERTAIAAVLPRSAVGNSLPLIFLPRPPAAVAGFLACLSSLALDFAARQKIGGTNLNLVYLKQLPLLPPDFYTPGRLSFVAPRVLELTYTSHRLAPFARDLDHHGPPFPWDEDRRALLRAELDAFFARAYGLTRDELRYILDPADVMGQAHPSETFRVLQKNEIHRHGEYRTRRLVLEAWDRMQTDRTFDTLDL
ncbi:MAG: hypothetical protein GDA41_01455 [Rhodospirillales bacterium]|nr:hypothetical protein [Rhodospirillales bacterium]